MSVRARRAPSGSHTIVVNRCSDKGIREDVAVAFASIRRDHGDPTIEAHAKPDRCARAHGSPECRHAGHADAGRTGEADTGGQWEREQQHRGRGVRNHDHQSRKARAARREAQGRQ